MLSTFKRDFKLVFKEMSLLDKLLPILIILAMIIGILLSVYVPSSRNAFNNTDQNKLTNVSIPLCIGLIIMMVPPLCKIEYENIKNFNKNKIRNSIYLKQILISLVINWIIGPFMMFGLAWATLFNEHEYRTGIIMIGMARCIAMVLIWNQLALGSNDLCALLVIINSLLQVILYAPYQILFCYVITNEPIDYINNISMGHLFVLVLKNIGIFLGIPLFFGVAIRFLFIGTVGIEKYNKKILPFISPWALIGLLYVIIVIFISKGDEFVHELRESLKCLIPLALYFLIMWFGTFFFLRYYSNYINFRNLIKLRKNSKEQNNVVEQTTTEETNNTDDTITEESKLLYKCGCEEKLNEKQKIKIKSLKCNATYSLSVTQAFTSSSNNFELSLAMAIALYGEGSKQAIAAVYGPLLEVPVLLLLTFVARYFRIAFIWNDVNIERDNNDDNDVNNSEEEDEVSER
ncbi:ARR3 [Candida pseudojiufengensis]|uniref:ARR3 n=1 Tax=Candida pseudojiufengensis TaxID=497109 RepID=UPI00222447F7|nr:ARR3 [Candida pseudojiufengensis]KAI5963194.1 ARR3 [Candida pseudojiufengensis]